ncbi:MAG TPA: CoA pyrophosphatase [Pyrinomonadaceae bacterium]|jgi:8-oxo-dGTP pyrophosphatase MutT (NUDIX family)
MSEFSSFVSRFRSRAAAGGLAPVSAAFESDEEGDSSQGSLRQAAVALVLREGLEGPELLVIKRSEAERDHWSGHLALPGGRVEAEDESLLATAVRETREEVGLDLSAGGEAVARLGTVRPQSPYAPRVSVTPFVAVAPHVYHAAGAGGPKGLELSEEVAAAFWLPVGELKRGGRSAVFRMAFAGVEREWPGYPSQHGVIWGITERILTEFLSLVD